MEKNKNTMIEISKNESKRILSPGVAYFAGVVSGLISIGMFLVSTSEGFFARIFFTSFSILLFLNLYIKRFEQKLLGSL